MNTKVCPFKDDSRCAEWCPLHQDGKCSLVLGNELFRRYIEAQELQALTLYSSTRPADLGNDIQRKVDAASKLLATKICFRHLKTTPIEGGDGQ